MTADPETRLRADARRNRDQILAAARAIFADHGPDVPMEEIARAAAVGVGTLYRRFPDRESLIREIARENFDRMLSQARAAADEEPTAWAALVRILRHSHELQLSIQLAMLSPMAHAVLQNDPKTEEFRTGLLRTIDEVVRAGQAEGSLRTDIDTGDVAILAAMLLRRVPKGRFTAIADLATDRCTAIMLDGLRAGVGTALPGRPLTADDIEPPGRTTPR
ncbi:helix-turn-helix domain-containing protein [Amycolatopsis minnesotensis]|uniref:TetR/AcrR family transcriptional regulator n=1 Tax=Amycolatopsis minnesotensis TaxID=337894 RepID=A0ABN2RUM8_9PSEU